MFWYQKGINWAQGVKISLKTQAEPCIFLFSLISIFPKSTTFYLVPYCLVLHIISIIVYILKLYSSDGFSWYNKNYQRVAKVEIRVYSFINKVPSLGDKSEF